MFAYTPIEYCDLTGAGILQLTSMVNDFRCAGAFKGCTNLKTLIVDNIEGDDFVGVEPITVLVKSLTGKRFQTVGID